jgi:hypothetical protein
VKTGDKVTIIHQRSRYFRADGRVVEVDGDVCTVEVAGEGGPRAQFHETWLRLSDDRHKPFMDAVTKDIADGLHRDQSRLRGWIDPRLAETYGDYEVDDRPGPIRVPADAQVSAESVLRLFPYVHAVKGPILKGELGPGEIGYELHLEIAATKHGPWRRVTRSEWDWLRREHAFNTSLLLTEARADGRSRVLRLGDHRRPSPSR